VKPSPSERVQGSNTPTVSITVTVWTPDGLGSRRQLRRYPDGGTHYTLVDGESQGILWNPSLSEPGLASWPVAPLPPDARPTGGGGTDPRGVALEILARIPLPDARVRMSPNLGLVALPSWYWVDGYRGETFGESRTITIPAEVGADVPVDDVPADDPRRQATSFTVEVRVRGARYDWSFGDGHGLVTRSLGQPYPAESDVQHTYEHSSLPFPGGFPVRVTVEFAAEFSVDGGAPQALPAVRRTYEAGFRVQEVQPVLVQRR
jgi:hypothetical protein